MKSFIITTTSLFFALALAACPDDGGRPLNAACSGDAQCASGLCLDSVCLDPDADSDSDGLINSVEGALGTSPLNPDSDGDGIADGEEVGADPGVARDTDGDGKIDAIESDTADADADCVTDQRDPDDAVPVTDPVVLASYVCPIRGVCAASGATVTASCVDAVPTCDFTQVPGYEADEAACDDADNDCDGATDEDHGAGGTVTFTDVDGTEGKVKGDTCGVGACAGGTVVCGAENALACSSASDGVAELCNDVDDDCDGETDEDFAVGGTVTFDGGPYAADAGKVLGDACGTGACADGTVVCDDDNATALTCSTLTSASAEACGETDDDCDGANDEGENQVGCTAYYFDGDRDGYGVTESGVCVCAPPEEDWDATASGDCIDSGEGAADVNPGAAICGFDADCDESPVDVGEACDDGDGSGFDDGCDRQCNVTSWVPDELEGGEAFRPVGAVAPSGTYALAWSHTPGIIAGPSLGGSVGATVRVVTWQPGEREATGTWDIRVPTSVNSFTMVGVEDDEFDVAWVEETGSFSDRTYTVNYGQWKADGTAIGTATATTLEGVEYVNDLRAIPRGAGRSALLWHETQSADFRGYLRGWIVAADGAMTPITEQQLDFLSGFAAIGREDGTFVTAWTTTDQQQNRGPLFQRYDADGKLVGEPTQVAEFSADLGYRSWIIGPFPDGGFMVLYTEFLPSTESERVVGQRFTSAGVRSGDPIDLTDGDDFSYDFYAAAQKDGTYSLVFGVFGDVASLTARIFGPDDALVTRVERLNDGNFGSDSLEYVPIAGPGWFLYVWGDYNGDGVNAIRVGSDGTRLYR